MYAIEFEADVKNGAIQILDQYSELESKRLRVFVVQVAKKFKSVSAPFSEPVIIPSYSLIAKRDEIYDR